MSVSKFSFAFSSVGTFPFLLYLHADDKIQVLLLRLGGCFLGSTAPILFSFLGYGSAEPLAWAGVNDPHDSKIGRADFGDLERMSFVLKSLQGRVNSASEISMAASGCSGFSIAHVIPTFSTVVFFRPFPLLFVSNLSRDGSERLILPFPV